jgi:hypothetical protein
METSSAGSDIGTPGAPPRRRRTGQRSIFQLVAGGFAGTVALALVMLVLEPAFVSRSPDPFRALGMELANPHGLGLVVLHFFNGTIVFPLGFAFFAGRVRAPWLAKGLIWGLILWLLAGLVVMPMSGFGPFGYHVGGLKVAASTLVAHLAYGGAQGLIASIPPRESD